MSSNATLRHHTTGRRLAAAAAMAGALGLGLAGPVLAKPVGPGDVATPGTSSGQAGPPSYNSSWPGYTPAQQGSDAPGPVTLGTDGIELVQVGLGALGGAALAGAGALALSGLHRRQRMAHA